MKKALIYIIVLLAVASCEKEEKPFVLPPPGDLTKVVADIGTNYLKAVYISLAKNTQQTRNWQDWDIAFEASETGSYVYLNEGKYMFACHTNSSDFATADSTGKEWRLDNDELTDDSTAVGKWWSNSTSSDVMVIDRGRIYYVGITASQRFKKIKIEHVNANEYVFSFCDYGSNTPVSYTITKDPNHSLMYFSFDDGGKMVDMSPPKDDWDFVLTRYAHIYYGEPLNSPYRNYMVNGGLNNKWNGVTGVRMIKDVSTSYIPFAQVTSNDAALHSYSEEANTIGFEWKIVDINTGAYNIVPDIYYILKDKNGFYYKIRFVDFYDDNGTKGYITFEYQRL
ncbi:MAG: HmuY family protein [Bacteroidota bacterium]